MADSNRYALIVANSQYTDSTLRQLTTPEMDAEALLRVLAACRRTRLTPKIIRQNADKRYFCSENVGFSIGKITKTGNYSVDFFSPTGC